MCGRVSKGTILNEQQVFFVHRSIAGRCIAWACRRGLYWGPHGRPCGLGDVPCGRPACYGQTHGRVGSTLHDKSRRFSKVAVKMYRQLRNMSTTTSSRRVRDQQLLPTFSQTPWGVWGWRRWQNHGIDMAKTADADATSLACVGNLLLDMKGRCLRSLPIYGTAVTAGSICGSWVII